MQSLLKMTRCRRTTAATGPASRRPRPAPAWRRRRATGTAPAPAPTAGAGARGDGAAPQRQRRVTDGTADGGQPPGAHDAAAPGPATGADRADAEEARRARHTRADARPRPARAARTP